eukprot:scaffold1523_cov426-Prasinococcus_capsulatus_cf.AAC.8
MEFVPSSKRAFSLTLTCTTTGAARKDLGDRLGGLLPLAYRRAIATGRHGTPSLVELADRDRGKVKGCPQSLSPRASVVRSTLDPSARRTIHNRAPKAAQHGCRELSSQLQLIPARKLRRGSMQSVVITLVLTP